jgi:DNA polymerase III gamma/tau subunit
MSEDNLPNKYRPTSFKQVIGQEKAVATLTRFLKAKKLPHQLMFTGPSGVGKTTLARILRTKLDCSERDFKEVNAALARGIDMVREIERTYRNYAMGGKSKIYLIDESQKLTGDAQSSLLKMVEDCPKHVYFMFATTDPGKVIPTLKNRCTEIRCQSIPDKDLKELARRICEAEDVIVKNAVGNKIVERAGGSARRLLVILNAVFQFETLEEQMAAIDSADPESQWYEIGVALIYKQVRWEDLIDLISGLQEADDWEGIRRRTVAMAGNILLDKNKRKFWPKASKLILQFGDNYYDNGRNGFINDAYRFCNGGG